MIKISKGSYATMVAFVMEAAPIAIGISPITRVAREDTWMVPWVAWGLVLLLLYPLYRLFDTRGSAMFQFNPPSRSLSLALIPVALILLFLISFNTRVFVDLIQMTYLPQTPEMVIALFVLGVCSYAAMMGGEVIARVSLISFVVKFAVIALAPFFAIGQLQFKFFTPFLADGVMPVIRSSLQPLAWFAEASVLVLIWPLVKGRRYRTVILGFTVGTMSFWLLTICCLLIFSAPLTAKFVYPALEFVQMMAMGDFLERIDAILASIWTMSMVVKISVYLYLLSIVMNRLFSVNIRNRFVYALALSCTWGAVLIAKDFPSYMMAYRFAWPILIAVLVLNLMLVGWLCGKVLSKQGHAPPGRSSSSEEAETVSR